MFVGIVKEDERFRPIVYSFIMWMKVARIYSWDVFAFYLSKDSSIGFFLVYVCLWERHFSIGTENDAFFESTKPLYLFASKFLLDVFAFFLRDYMNNIDKAAVLNLFVTFFSTGIIFPCAIFL